MEIKTLFNLVVCAGITLSGIQAAFAQTRVSITRSDGSIIDYASLTRAFEDLTSGDTLRVYGRHVIVPSLGGGGLGSLSAPLRAVNLTNVVIQGVANAQIYGEGSGDFLALEACHQLRVENINFIGNNPPAGQDLNGLFAMILLRGTNTDITVSRCRFANFGNHGISHLWDPKVSSRVLITECVFENGGAIDVPKLGGDGAAVSGIGSSWTVEKCSVIDCVRGFEIENGGENAVEDIRILNNFLTGIKDLGVMLFVSNRDGSKFADIQITGNTFKHFTNSTYSATAIRLAGGRRIRIRGNVVTDMARQGIAVLTDGIAADVEIAGNMIDQVGNNGITLERTTADFTNANVTDNMASRCGEAGIRVVDVGDATISGNICYNNAWAVIGAAIEVLGTNSQRALLRGNKCYDSQSTKTQEYGIFIGPGVSASLVHDNYCLNSQAILAGIKDEGVQTDLSGNKTLPGPLPAQSNRSLLFTAVLVNAPPSASISLQPDGNVLLTWETLAMETYLVEFKSNLLDPKWTPLTAAIMTANPTTATISDNLGQNLTRFYRIRATVSAVVREGE